MNNLFEQGQRSRYESSVSLIYILAHESLSNLVNIEAKRVPLIDVRGSYYGDPLNTAIPHESAKTLNALLAGKTTECHVVLIAL